MNGLKSSKIALKMSLGTKTGLIHPYEKVSLKIWKDVNEWFLNYLANKLVRSRIGILAPKNIPF